MQCIQWRGLPTHRSGLADSDDEYSQSSEKRLTRVCHAEHDISDPLDQQFNFIPAYTRHSSYHLAAAAYVDLVDDPNLQAEEVRSQHCLRLRTKLRQRSYAVDETGVEHFDSRVLLWPSEDALRSYGPYYVQIRPVRAICRFLANFCPPHYLSSVSGLHFCCLIRSTYLRADPLDIQEP